MSDLENSKKIILSFKPMNDWRFENQRLYSKNAKLTICANDVKCFIGCNGAGKSTLLEQIESKLKHKHFVELEDDKNPFRSIFGDEELADGYIIHFDAEFKISEGASPDFIEHFSRMSRSTGETLFYRFGDAVKYIGEYVRKAKAENKPLVLMWDDCDVGTSIDIQDDIVNFINFLKDDFDSKGIEYAIILTANSYELCRTFDCYDCNTLKQIEFYSYEEYREFVLTSRKKKNEREDAYAKSASSAE